MSSYNSTSYDFISGDPETAYTPYNQRLETYLVPVLFAIIFIVGVLGNGTLVIMFLRDRSMRNVPNTYGERERTALYEAFETSDHVNIFIYYRYILSLALADLLVIVTCVPFISIIYTVEYWPWGTIVCKLSETTKDVSIGVSVFTLTALSAERYCAIVNPLRKLQTKPLTVLSAVLIWVLACIFALPSAVFSNVHDVDIGKNKSILICSPFPHGDYQKTYMQFNVVAKALTYYILPLIVIACFYVMMAQRLHASAREMPGEFYGAQSVAQARARRHVARMVLAFVIVFFMCFLPYHLFELWFHLNPTALDDYNDYWHALRIVGFCLSFLNSCVNPVALYCVSGVFRQQFNRYLCCRNPRRVPRRGPSSANCETSFNSTYRRHTADSTYRKQMLARQNTQDTTLVALDTFKKCEDFDVKNSVITRNDNENGRHQFGS